MGRGKKDDESSRGCEGGDGAVVGREDDEWGGIGKVSVVSAFGSVLNGVVEGGGFKKV